MSPANVDSPASPDANLAPAASPSANIDSPPTGDRYVAPTNSTLSPHTGRFHDWHWTCPACHRGVRKLYFPLPVPYVETYLNLRLAPPGHTLHEADAPPIPLPTFACEDCHHLTHIDERSYKGWNAFVTHLTCGLLYGHEVPRPEEWPYELPATYRKGQPATRADPPP